MARAYHAFPAAAIGTIFRPLSLRWARLRPIYRWEARRYITLRVAQFRGVAVHFFNKPGEEVSMNAVRIAGIVLIVGGLVGFFTGGFSFTKDTTAAKIGPIELTVKEKESVNIPQWLSLGAVALGAIVLVAGSRKS